MAPKLEIYKDSSDRWGYRTGGAKFSGYANKDAAIKAGIEEFIKRNPKYNELVAGKSWQQVVAMFNL